MHTATAHLVSAEPRHPDVQLHHLRTPQEAGVDPRQPSANDAQIDRSATAKRSLLAAAIGVWEAQAAAFRPVALDVGPWLPSAAPRDAAAQSTAATLMAAVGSVIARISAARETRQRRREAMRDIEILRQLDDATLRDIGVMRDEIPAAAYERARRFGG